jgi:hypothetical protein
MGRGWRATAVLICLALTSAALAKPPRQHWIDPKDAPSPVMVDAGYCLDLGLLPKGWRVSSATTATSVMFGVPGRTKMLWFPRYRLLVGMGEEGDSGLFTRGSLDEWGEPSGAKPSPRLPEWDVERFEAYAADDGGLVYVSDDLNALMGCWPDVGCTVEDGKQRRPGEMSFLMPLADSAAAAEKLELVRTTIASIRTTCPADGARTSSTKPG